MDPNISLALASGLSPVCGTCAKWHRAAERGLDRCLSIDNCGSPLVEDTFHEYDGPISNFLSLCFVCGESPNKAVAVVGHARRIGVCNKHVEYLSNLKPQTQRRLPIAPRTLIDDSGEKLVPEPPKPKKTLGTLLNKIAAEDAAAIAAYKAEFERPEE